MNFEPFVMQYLASQGLFVSPQFSISAGRTEWSCPDFVALDFRKAEVRVVEVSVAYAVEDLIGKIRNREQQWFEKLRTQLPLLGIPVQGWNYSVSVFVRRDRCESIRHEFSGITDVRVEAIEDIAFSWKWPWDEWAKA